MKVKPETLREVEAAGLLPNTQTTYLLHARNFVRWLDDDFIPGDRLPSSRRRRR